MTTEHQIESVTVADGKYTVLNDNGKLTALRYGEPWQDLTGNNLVYWMMVEILGLKAELAKHTSDKPSILGLT